MLQPGATFVCQAGVGPAVRAGTAGEVKIIFIFTSQRDLSKDNIYLHLPKALA
ncbi:hypothetical protein HMPREF3198_02075 [Winkia neuii]|nr:hypothetical protein HMPREF3198_02075 [Winkia neuii]